MRIAESFESNLGDSEGKLWVAESRHDNEKVRAAELKKILVQLGPAYIKIAQAISSRPDLIPPSYLDELSILQDRIAPFSTELAFDIIERELGLPIDVLFSEISPEPVAAASLGQVYQARLRSSGKVVAIKVQRPGVRAAISLDILILRFLAGVIRRAGKLNTDLQSVVDEWASSLFPDYRRNVNCHTVEVLPGKCLFLSSFLIRPFICDVHDFCITLTRYLRFVCLVFEGLLELSWLKNKRL